MRKLSYRSCDSGWGGGAQVVGFEKYVDVVRQKQLVSIQLM